MRGKTNSWFKSYFVNKKLRVKNVTASSSTPCILYDLPITYGTAKGTILVPFLLF